MNTISRISIFCLTVSISTFLFIVQTGCTKTEVAVENASDEKEVTKIEKGDWPSCASESRKTVYDAYFESEEFAERLLLAGRVSTVLEELDKSRDKFLETGDLIEIFPLLLFYETKASLDLGLKPQITHKLEFMRLLLRRYDAYKTNRDLFESGELIAVDRQWRSYFEAAQKAQTGGVGKWTPKDGVDVLLEGVNAYVIYDLSRAVRFVVSDSEIENDVLERDFEASSELYSDAEQLAKADIRRHFTSAADVQDVDSMFGNGSQYVAFARNKAWEMGVGDGPLGVLSEQPVLIHDAGSRKFFPKELMDRGICR